MSSCGKWVERVTAVGVLVGTLGLYSCTPQKETAFPPDEDSKAEPVWSSSRVTDPLGAWSLSLDSVQPVEVIDQAAFTHLIVPLPAGEKQHCFVYREPMLPGAAILKFFNSVSSGLLFSSFRLNTPELNDGRLLLHFEGAYKDQEGKEGRMHLSVSPLLDMPLVCSLDAGKSQPDFFARARRAHETFSGKNPFREKGAELQFFSLENAVSQGFELRASQVDEEGSDAARVSATFSFDAGRLRVTDRTISSRADSTGLLGTSHRYFQGGQPQLMVRLDREEASANAPFVYRVEAGGRGTLKFTTKKALWPGNELGQRLKKETLRNSWLEYVPAENLGASTQVKAAPDAEPGWWRKTQGETVLRYRYNEKGSLESYELLGGASGSDVLLRAKRVR